MKEKRERTKTILVIEYNADDREKIKKLQAETQKSGGVDLGNNISLVDIDLGVDTSGNGSAEDKQS